MKISELVQVLNTVQEAEGDLEICTRNDEFGVFSRVEGAYVEVFKNTLEEKQWGDCGFKHNTKIVCL